MISEIAFAIQGCVCSRLTAIGRPIKCCCIGLERPVNEAAYVLVAPGSPAVEPETDLLEENCVVSSWHLRFSVIIGRCIKDNTCNGTSSEALTFIDDIEEAMFAINCCVLPGSLGKPTIFQTNFRLFEDGDKVFNEAEIIVRVKSKRPWGAVV